LSCSGPGEKLLEFMGGSNGKREEFQSLTDIAGNEVGGGGRLCLLANSQDESLVQFWSEVHAFAFFRPHGRMVPAPFTLLGARQYLGSIGGQRSAAQVCGRLADKDWLNGNIMTTTAVVSVNNAVRVSVPATSFVALASSLNPECDHVAAQQNKCAAQRGSSDKDIRRWYQAYEPTMYNMVVQDAFRTIVRSIGTGPWGSGVWYGDSQMYFLRMWLATSLIPDMRLDYYVYSYFCENEGNQCMVLGGTDCEECLNSEWFPDQIPTSRCGAASHKDMMAKYQGQTAQVLYNALGRVGPPPAQVFDTLASVPVSHDA